MPDTTLPIIGYPLAQTPLEGVLRDALEASGASVQIKRWERRPHQLADAVTELRQEPYVGALIGSPHKEKAPALANSLSDDARASGAVNLLVRNGANLRGHNTDMDGIRAGLAAILPKVQGKWPRQAVVLGAGGGARAVVAVLIGSGFQRVAVFNRHLHRAEALVGHFARSARHMDLRARPWHEAIIEAELAKAQLLVNASGVGERGESPVSGELIPEDRYVLDLVLNQATTPLMREAEARGGTVANGQASFIAGVAVTTKLLTGSEPPGDRLREALARELGVPVEGLAVVGD
jgi:shikimate dehydrogenase